MNIFRRGCVRLLLPAILLSLGVARLNAADTLRWNQQKDRVDADIRTWDVHELLEYVAADTGWHVFLDPGAIRPVSAKFKGLPPNEALKALLSGLNYLLIPQTNGTTELYVFRTSRGQATTFVAPVKKPAQPIPNELVVTLKPGSKTKIDDLAKSLGAKVIGRMDSQNTYLLQFDDQTATDAARAQLASNPDVASVDVNYPVDAPPTPDASQASGPNLKLNPQTNTGPCQLVVGLIDTPVEPLPASMSQFLEPAISVAGPNQIPSTQLTHGTAMAETILDALQPATGGNSSVKILPVDVYGNSESTTTFDVANGIVQAVNNGANILNLSLGSTGNSQLLQNVVNQALQQGIPIYAAAGNQPVTTPTYPAAYPGVVAVTASGPSGGIAPYANRGSFVQIVAPGDNVVPFDGQNFMVEGTSTSTAIISGMAAGLADSAHVCADQANALLQKAANNSNVIRH